MNRYEILGVVGEGAYGIVLKCRSRETGEIVAIKKFKESDDDDIVRKTTNREVKTLRSLHHANIVSLKETFRRKGKLFLVFEYVERNLLEVLEEHPSGIDPEEVRFYIYELLRAVAHCHRKNIIHRDIKPENLLIHQGKMEGRLKLCDFGFARTLPGKHEVALTDYVSTRWYRSPELLLGCIRYGAEVDLWAIGCIMAELISGQPLFPGDSDIDQLYLIQKLLGSLTMEQTKLFLLNRSFAGFKFPDMSNHQTLESKFSKKLDPEALQFLRGLLDMNPGQRLTAAECLKHPYLSRLEMPLTRPVTASTRGSCRISPCNITSLLHAHQQQQKLKKKREICLPSDDDSTLSVGTRVTIEPDTSRGFRPLGERSRKRQHVAESLNGSKRTERARRKEPSKEAIKAPVQSQRLSRPKQMETHLVEHDSCGLRHVVADKLTRNGRIAHGLGQPQISGIKNDRREETPRLASLLPLKSYKQQKHVDSRSIASPGNSLTILNPEAPANGLLRKERREQRLATRHGFPFPSQGSSFDRGILHPLPEDRLDDIEFCQRQSISSQGRVLSNAHSSAAVPLKSTPVIYSIIQENR